MLLNNLVFVTFSTSNMLFWYCRAIKMLTQQNYMKICECLVWVVDEMDKTQMVWIDERPSGGPLPQQQTPLWHQKCFPCLGSNFYYVFEVYHYPCMTCCLLVSKRVTADVALVGFCSSVAPFTHSCQLMLLISCQLYLQIHKLLSTEWDLELAHCLEAWHLWFLH